jgi:hypothetical protein
MRTRANRFRTGKKRPEWQRITENARYRAFQCIFSSLLSTDQVRGTNDESAACTRKFGCCRVCTASFDVEGTMGLKWGIRPEAK